MLKNSILIGSYLFFASAFFISCNNDKTEIKSERASEEPKITVDSIYFKYQKLKKDYDQKILDKIVEIDRRIQELNSQLAKTPVKIKSKIQEEIKLREERKLKLTEFRKKIEKISKENWDNFEKDLKETLLFKSDSIKSE